METKTVSPKEFAKIHKYHKSYIHRLLKGEELQKKFPEVISVKKYSRFYTIEFYPTIKSIKTP